MNGKIMIVGTGNVGSSIAYALLNQRTAVQEIVLTDINQADAEGEAMDLADAATVSPNAIRIHAGTYQEAGGCDMCIIAAGANQKPNESRTDLVHQNVAILRSIVEPVMQSGFRGIFIVVSNPVDTLAYLTQQISGLSYERIIGSGTVLDSARLRSRLAEELAISPKSIHAYQVGEHGDSEFTLWSTATVGGQKITGLIPRTKRAEIETFVRDKAYQIIQKKGATYYGIGNCVTQIIQAIVSDERRVLTVSNYDDNTDTYNGFPAIIGAAGVIRRLETPLTEQEAIKFQQSVNTIKTTLREAIK